MRISDCSSDVCSSDLDRGPDDQDVVGLELVALRGEGAFEAIAARGIGPAGGVAAGEPGLDRGRRLAGRQVSRVAPLEVGIGSLTGALGPTRERSEVCQALFGASTAGVS